MLKNLSTAEVVQILNVVGITFKRHGKEDVYAGEYNGKMRIVIVPRNKKSIPAGTLSSIWRQAGLTAKQAEEVWLEL
jgi:predicted RNA binding protein YcfA (HicA-like mRNA interferase family)